MATKATDDKMAKLTVKSVEDSLRRYEGNITAVGRALATTRQSVHKFMNRHPALLEVAKECRESLKDEAESALHIAIRKGEAWAVCFYLKTVGKDRGYVERQELTGADGGPMMQVIRDQDDGAAEQAASES